MQETLSTAFQPESPLSVPRLQAHEIHPEAFLQTYVIPGRPVVISGLLDGEPNWDLDFLIQHLGDRTFPVRKYGRDRYQQDKRDWQDMGSGVALRSMPFAEYADLIRSGEAYEQDLYLGRCGLGGTPLADAPVFQKSEAVLGLKGSMTPLNLWCGPAGHTSCLHYDPLDGTLTQLYGTKHIILFPPSQLYNLHPFSVWNHLIYGLRRRAVYSQVYPDRPDFEAFPRYRKALAQRYDVMLHAGEILFIPSCWWHEVTSIGTGMVCSVNRWWNVPLGRSLRTWSKWRAHIGSLLALPHIAWDLLSVLPATARKHKLKALIQRL
ncbi:cupin-like domain-containing protein [Leptolyngbya sp. AN02str]|uniref:cupin-like domain-containing protein n=1 Tax=Leptolyngbya sp. AN02str TaxID=3423363 RepID=UPI003D323FF6